MIPSRTSNLNIDFDPEVEGEVLPTQFDDGFGKLGGKYGARPRVMCYVWTNSLDHSLHCSLV